MADILDEMAFYAGISSFNEQDGRTRAIRSIDEDSEATYALMGDSDWALLDVVKSALSDVLRTTENIEAVLDRVVFRDADVENAAKKLKEGPLEGMMELVKGLGFVVDSHFSSRTREPVGFCGYGRLHGPSSMSASLLCLQGQIAALKVILSEATPKLKRGRYYEIDIGAFEKKAGEFRSRCDGTFSKLKDGSVALVAKIAAANT